MIIHSSLGRCSTGLKRKIAWRGQKMSRRNRLQVETKPYVAAQRREKIRNILKEHPEGLYPKHIAYYTGINQNTVKSALKEMGLVGETEIVGGLRGLYRLVEKRTHDIFLYNLHNVILSFKSDQIYVQNTIDETDSLEDFIKFHFQIGKESKQATMHVSTDYPMNISTIGVLVRLFQEFVFKHTSVLVGMKDVVVSSMEFNKDHLYLRIEGANCITYGSLVAEFKLYNKRNCVREEVRIKIPFTPEILIKLLQQGVVSAEVMAAQKNANKRLEILESIQRKSSHFMANLFNLLVEKFALQNDGKVLENAKTDN